MTDPRIEKLAKVLTQYSLRVQRNDLFRIVGSTLSAPLIRAVYREALVLGANPYVRTALDGLEEIYYKFATDDQLRFISELDRLEFELPATMLVISGRSNTRELTNVPPTRISLRRDATRALQQRYMERAAQGKLRWCLTQYPTQAEAQDAEMSLSEYEDFVFAAGMLDREDPVAAWEQVRRDQAQIGHSD